MESTEKWEKNPNEKKQMFLCKANGDVNPFGYVPIAFVCMWIHKTEFLKEKWRVKLNKSNDCVPAKIVAEE